MEFQIEFFDSEVQVYDFTFGWPIHLLWIANNN